MSFCFLFFGYLGVPVPFSLMAGVFLGALLTDVSLAAIIQKIFDGMDSEALLAIPFFLLVGELMSSANVVVRIANLRSEEHTSELQSPDHLVCRLLLEKKKTPADRERINLEEYMSTSNTSTAHQRVRCTNLFVPDEPRLGKLRKSLSRRRCSAAHKSIR